MTFAPRSAAELLDSATAPAWARFDADWYRQTYPEAADVPPDELRAWYLEHGQKRGHAPNPWIDETWFRARNHDMAEAVARAEIASGFDGYCRGAFLDRSPHWLFAFAHYQEHAPDLTEEGLHAVGFWNHYDHFLQSGATEGRSAHPLFDAGYYTAALPAAERPAAAKLGAWRHYLLRLSPASPEPRTTPYFDPHWYRARYPEVEAAIGAGTFRGALHHFLTNPEPGAYDPLPLFQEEHYLERSPDVAQAVARGDERSGYLHFVRAGARELRSPSPAIDLRYYATAHPEVEADIAAGRARDPFAHYLLFGAAAGLPPTAPAAAGLPAEAEARTLFNARARTNVAALARTRLDFTPRFGIPPLSVVMVLHNQFALTLNALASLRQNYAGDVELILIDSGSTDETQHLRRFVIGARLLRFDMNLGFVQGCNAGLYSVTAPHVLFLNNDIELAPGAVSAALRRLAGDTSIGAVGGKVVRSNGLLQEAGCILWRNGSTLGYLRDADPLAPEANFLRDVDFCSGVFLMVRTEALVALDGFDSDFAPAYGEDVDLCLRIWQRGLRVVYDPAVVVHHLEHGSSSVTQAAARMVAAREVLLAKHPAALAARHPDQDGVLRARTHTGDKAGPPPRRVLYIDDAVPLRIAGSGFVRGNDILHVMAGLGLHVGVFPVNGCAHDLAAVFADMPETAEVLHDRNLHDLPAFLAARRGYYDTVWIARTHNLDRLAETLLPWLDSCTPRPLVVLDTEAVVSLREAVRATVAGNAAAPGTPPADLEAALAHEFRNARNADRFVAVNETEAAALRGQDLDPVHVIGHVRDVRLTPRAFADRAGMLFVGAIHMTDSPNYDSLCWFIDEVLPLIEAELGWETRLTVIGHLGPNVSLDRFADHPRVTLRGAVADTWSAYDSHRLFVAPTRYAAGTPYKVHEAASLGLPVVASTLIAEQLGWLDGPELAAAPTDDPVAYAAAVLRVYRDADAWRQLREAAAARVAEECERGRYVAAIRRVLDPTPETEGGNVTAFPRPAPAETV
jgi:GT2 family glycosyltransferase